MILSGTIPNIPIIFILENKEEDFDINTRYFDHKEQYHFFLATKRHHEKSTSTLTST
jgi:hypothetical protein